MHPFVVFRLLQILVILCISINWLCFLWLQVRNPWPTSLVLVFLISIGYCKKDVTPLLTHWSYLHLSCIKPSISSSDALSSFIQKFGKDLKVHGANMGPTWVLSAPDRPMLAPWTLLSTMLIKQHQLLHFCHWCPWEAWPVKILSCFFTQIEI